MYLNNNNKDYNGFHFIFLKAKFGGYEYNVRIAPEDQGSFKKKK